MKVRLTLANTVTYTVHCMFALHVRACTECVCLCVCVCVYVCVCVCVCVCVFDVCTFMCGWVGMFVYVYILLILNINVQTMIAKSVC